MEIQYPEKVQPLFDQLLLPPEQRKPYIVMYGGRGSAKSESACRYSVLLTIKEPTLVLGARESQNSLADSVHALLADFIISNKLEGTYFKIERDKIYNKRNGSKFIFKGLRQEAGHIRSLYKAGLVWIEEGQYVEAPGFISLDDTIRKDGSQIMMVLNPRFADDHIYSEFIAKDRDDTLKININILENPFATQRSKDKARRLQETNPEAFRHVYMGELAHGSETIGAFRKIPKFTAEYRVAFIDTSFSDNKDTDRTTCGIVGFSINEIDDIRQCPIEFTGMSWQKSITNQEVIEEMLVFLDRYQPIETCIEANLGGDGLANTFIDRFKLNEDKLNIKTKNFWTTFHQTRNKHERIMASVGANKTRVFALDETQPEYLNPIINYTKRIEHDDEIDSLAGAINLWLTSPNLRNYIYQFEQLKKQRLV